MDQNHQNPVNICTNSPEESRSTNLKELHGHQSEALLLEALDDFSHQAALHAVGFDGDEGALGFGSHDSEEGNERTDAHDIDYTSR